jgi:integrase
MIGRLHTDLLEATSPRLPRTLKETFPAEDVSRLLTVIAANSCNPRGDAALVRFTLDMGCRANEVCGLHTAEVVWQERQAKVFSKGRNERYVFFSAASPSPCLVLVTRPGSRQVARPIASKARRARTADATHPLCNSREEGLEELSPSV